MRLTPSTIEAESTTAASVALPARPSSPTMRSRITRTRSETARTSGRSDEITTRPRCAGLIVKQVVDLGLRADVHAAGRLVHDQHARPRQQPSGQDDFLLVAAAEVRAPARPAPGRRRGASGTAPRGGPARPSRHHHVPNAAGPRRRHSPRYSCRGTGQRPCAPRAGSRCRPRSRRPGDAERDAAAVDPTSPARRRPGPEQGQGQLRPTGPDQAGQADDLAGPRA